MNRLIRLEGTGDAVIATVYEAGKPVRAVSASRGVVADAMQVLARLRELPTGEIVVAPPEVQA